MTLCVIMTEAEKDQVQGLSAPSHRLEPRLLLDGTFAVNIGVCSDPHHASKHGFLRTLPVRGVTSDDFPPEEE